MAILCAREKWQQNEVEKSNFLHNLHHKYLIRPLIYAVKSRRSKRLRMITTKDQRDGDDSQFCRGTYPVFTLIIMSNALNETEADVSK